jgi:hypothetical protein
MNTMETIILRAHFDGEQIQLDDPFELRPNAKLLVTVLPQLQGEHLDWLRLSMQGLNAAYGTDEPEYPLTAIKEHNPIYDERG